MNEPLTKAAQCANLFVSDLREAYKASPNIATEELLIAMIKQAAEMERVLKRLAEEK